MASTASNHVPCGYNGHYHLYMTITQNKRNASTNQSNVTVKMYAQSDSSSYGAYNLDASGNTVKMTVNINKSSTKQWLWISGTKRLYNLPPGRGLSAMDRTVQKN